jgi:hypothetical protein
MRLDERFNDLEQEFNGERGVYESVHNVGHTFFVVGLLGGLELEAELESSVPFALPRHEGFPDGDLLLCMLRPTGLASDFGLDELLNRG